jgi:hypothetical protein
MYDAVNESRDLSVGLPLKSVTPHVLAVTMLRFLMEMDKEWRTVEAEITSEAHSKFPMACEFYQLRIFLDLLKQRFGAGISGLVEASLTSVSKDTGMDLFSMVMAAISCAREIGPIVDGPDDSRINMDCQIADQCLRILSEPDEEKLRFRLILAESLTYARVWAEGIFPKLVAKIEFDPVSVAFLRIETAYKGLTNRWRESPGCFERHLQRMEGNPLFSESQRDPTDEAILEARAKDDAESEKLVHDVEAFFADIDNMNERGPIQGRAITDLMQHRIEPLMVRSAEIGQLPAAERSLAALTGFMESMLDVLNLGSDQREGFRKSWRNQTNVFIAQSWWDGGPIHKENSVLALLCENVEQVKRVLDIYKELNAGLVDNMRKVALAHFEIAELEGFTIPGKAEKLALFRGETEPVPNPELVKPRPWWRVWGRSSG